MRHTENVPRPPVTTPGPTGLLGQFQGNPGECALLRSTPNLHLTRGPRKARAQAARDARMKSLGGALGRRKGDKGEPALRPASLLRGCPQSRPPVPLRTPAARGRASEARVPPARRQTRAKWSGPPPGRPPRLLHAARRARPHPHPPRGAPAPLSSPSGLGGALYSHPGLGFALMRNVINPEKRAERQERRRGRGGGEKSERHGEFGREIKKSPESAGPRAGGARPTPM